MKHEKVAEAGGVYNSLKKESSHKGRKGHEDVPEGYKRTEVGVIPEDWNLSELFKITQENGLIRGPFGGSLKKESFRKKGYKVYEQRNAIYSDFRIGNYYIDETKYRELSRFATNEDDFIISCSGTIGRIYKIPPQAPKGVINQALLKISINPRLVDSTFFINFFRWFKFQQTIIDSTQGGAMQNLIGMSDFKRIQLPLPPPLPEQKAIAKVLSDTDALIETLDKLIAKKKAIKEGAMQELLTGKRRLPGFGPGGKEEKRGISHKGRKEHEEVPEGYKRTEVGVIPEDWKEERIETIAQIHRGASPRPIEDPKWFDYKSNIGWLRISDVTSSGKHLHSTVQKLSEAGIAQSRFVGEKMLVMSICATVGRPIITDIPVCIHDGFCSF